MEWNGKEEDGQLEEWKCKGNDGDVTVGCEAKWSTAQGSKKGK